MVFSPFLAEETPARRECQALRRGLPQRPFHGEIIVSFKRGIGEINATFCCGDAVLRSVEALHGAGHAL